MNILFNNYCNLKCPYCFANGEMQQLPINLSEENLKWFIEFLKRSNIDTVSVLGGEPTLHPDFINYLNIIKESNMGLFLFTNGTFNDDIRAAIMNLAQNVKVGMLVNFNNSNISGEKVFTIINNIHALKQNNVAVGLGINIYQENQPLEELFLVCERLDVKALRWAITIPNYHTTDVESYFRKLIPTACELAIWAKEKGVELNYDCNSIPLCLLSKEEIEIIQPKYRCSGFAIDISPNLEIIKCFSNHYGNLKDFNDFNELKTFSKEIVKKEFSEYYLFDKCKVCNYADNKCCICHSFF